MTQRQYDALVETARRGGTEAERRAAQRILERKLGGKGKGFADNFRADLSHGYEEHRRRQAAAADEYRRRETATAAAKAAQQAHYAEVRARMRREVDQDYAQHADELRRRRHGGDNHPPHYTNNPESGGIGLFELIAAALLLYGFIKAIF